MDNMRVLLVFPLFYLTITSGLPPGLRRMRIETEGNSTTNAEVSDVSIIGNLSGTTLLPTPEQSSADTEAVEVTSTTALPLLYLPTSTGRADSVSPAGTTTSHHGQDEMHFNGSTDRPILSPLVQNITKVRLRGKCYTSSQCIGEWTECRFNVCRCISGYLPRIDDGDLCGEESLHHVQLPTTDPTMIGVVVGLVLMSVTLCVVLRLFAKARFRENRTIFNTPNPRLMNVTLLKGNKPLVRGNSAPRSRRGSTISARSGAEAGTPTSPTRHLDPSYPHEGGNGASVPVAGSSRPKPPRQLSTDTCEGTPPARPASVVHKQRFRHQDSVASNV